MEHTVLVQAPVQVTDGSLERVSPGNQERGAVSGRTIAAGVGKEGCWRWHDGIHALRSQTRGSWDVDSPCDYGLFTNPSYCVHKQNVFGTRAGGLLCSTVMKYPYRLWIKAQVPSW